MNTLLLKLLKNARLNCKLTQKEVAAKLGIKDNTLSNWEKGRTEPDIDTFVKLCDIYNVYFADLLEQAYRSHANDNLNFKEERILEAYRKQPELRVAVERVLGIYNDTESIKERPTAHKTAEDDPKETIEIMPGEYENFKKERTQTYKIAARDGKNTIELTPEQRKEFVRASKEDESEKSGGDVF